MQFTKADLRNHENRCPGFGIKSRKWGDKILGYCNMCGKVFERYAVTKGPRRVEPRNGGE